MKLPAWARRADPDEERLVAEVKSLREGIETLVVETKRLAEWATKHDGIHAQLFKHVMQSMGDDSAKASAELAKFVYAKAKAQLIDKLIKLAFAAVGTFVIAQLGLSSLRLGGFDISLGSILP